MERFNFRKYEMLLIFAAMAGFTMSCKRADVCTKEIVVCCYGADVKKTIPETLGGIEKQLKKNYPEYKVEICFTSDHIIKYLKETSNYTVKNMDQTLTEAAESGIEEVIVQPIYFLNGVVLESVVQNVMTYKSKFKKLQVADYLLASNKDFEDVADVVIKRTSEYACPDTAICIAGHGTSADTNSEYLKFQEVIRRRGQGLYYVGTVETTPSVDDLIVELKKNSNIKNVVIIPLMIDGGSHIMHDIAGDDEDSWKSKFLSKGYNVKCINEGLGIHDEIQKIFVRHTKEVM